LQPSEGTPTIPHVVFHALLICSDEACAEEIEAFGTRLDELEAMACECGCGLQLIAVSEIEFERAALPVVLDLAA
jgi:uncharacterized protein (UPF0210 family)